MKNILLACSMLFSVGAFAKTLASDALVNAVKPGLYNGTTDAGTDCQVSVTVFPGFYQSVAQISATDGNAEVTYNINNSTAYATGRVGKQNVLFLQNEIQDGNTVGSVKIINANDNKINVSIGNYQFDGREREAAEVSCNI